MTNLDKEKEIETIIETIADETLDFVSTKVHERIAETKINRIKAEAILRVIEYLTILLIHLHLDINKVKKILHLKIDELAESVSKQRNEANK